MTNFDCITCDDACLLQARRQQNDPFRRGNEMRTCDAEIDRLGLEHVPLEEMPDGTPYRIDEYDGSETVITASAQVWRIAGAKR